MKQKYRVRHQDIVDFVKTLPKEITSGRESIFTVICRNTPCSAGVFPVDGRCKATFHKNKGRNNIQSSVYLK